MVVRARLVDVLLLLHLCPGDMEKTEKNLELITRYFADFTPAQLKQIEALENEINAASDKLGQTASDFAATYQALLGQIQDDVKNIESHL